MGIALPADLPHYSYDDYVRWEGRWELIGGIPYAMSPSPTFAHQRVSTRIAVALEEALEGCPRCQAVQDFDWKLNEHTVVCPDNLVICHEPENQNYLTRAPVLIFEILSPSTASRDEGLKLRLYEAEGVRWYVIANPEERVAKIYRLHEGRYVKEADVSRESFDFDLDHCRVGIDFARLWK